MIRFINLQDQICADTDEFAFYDTIRSTFLTFSGSQTWETVSEFVSDFQDDYQERYPNIERFTEKIPDDWLVQAH